MMILAAELGWASKILPLSPRPSGLEAGFYWLSLALLLRLYHTYQKVGHLNLRISSASLIKVYYFNKTIKSLPLFAEQPTFTKPCVYNFFSVRVPGLQRALLQPLKYNAPFKLNHKKGTLNNIFFYSSWRVQNKIR